MYINTKSVNNRKTVKTVMTLTWCHSDIGDEYHYILQCQYFKPSRKLLLSKYYSNHVNVLKFRNLMTSKNKTVLTKLCKLIKIIEKVFCDPS